MLCCITGPYPVEMVLFLVGKRLVVGLSRPSSSDHIKCIYYAKYVYPHGMHGRASEVVETIGCRRIQTCCVQESR